MIRCEALCFRYRRSGPTVFRDVTADFPAGAMTALTGPSGSGKSTLLYNLALLLTPTSGRTWLDGVETTGLSDGRRSWLRAQHMGFVFQDALLDPARSILDNVLEGGLYAGCPRRAAVSAARDLLMRLGVEHRIEHRPGEISGGQAQRVALCRALLGRPRLLIADEPSGNLDAGTADEVWSLLQTTAREGACVIVATHDERRAAACEQRLAFL